MFIITLYMQESLCCANLCALSLVCLVHVLNEEILLKQKKTSTHTKHTVKTFLSLSSLKLMTCDFFCLSAISFVNTHIHCPILHVCLYWRPKQHRFLRWFLTKTCMFDAEMLFVCYLQFLRSQGEAPPLSVGHSVPLSL